MKKDIYDEDKELKKINKKDKKEYTKLNKGIDEDNKNELNLSEMEGNNYFFKKISESILKIYQKIVELFFIIKEKFLKCIEIFLFNDISSTYIFLINFISFAFYFLSLEECGKDITECMFTKGMKFFIRIGVFVFISSIFFGLYISLVIFHKKYFSHFLYVIPIYFIYFFGYTGTDVDEHGLYNTMGWIFFTFVTIPAILVIIYILSFIKTKKIKHLIILLSMIIILIILYFSYQSKFSCNDWHIGINNTRINNDRNKYKCYIKIPKVCYIKTFNGTFDISKYIRPTCSDISIRKNEYKTYIKSLGEAYNNGSKRYGYPITIDDYYKVQHFRHNYHFSQFVLNHSIPMDLFGKGKYKNSLKPEVEIEFDDITHLGTIYMKVNRNETLVKERKKISEKVKSLYNNVLILYLDTVSRMQFYRKLKKVVEIFKPYFKYNINENEKKFTAFEFLKYNSLKAFTYDCIRAMFYGQSIKKEKNGTNLVKYYKERGFITGHTGTTCGKEIFNQVRKTQDLDFDIYDHENVALFCDHNFFSSRYSLTQGVNSVIQRCLYGKPTYYYAMEYTKLFWEAYKDSKKFFRIHLNEGHEATLELISYLENDFAEFIKYFFDNNLLNDTAIFFISDHGCHFLNIWRLINNPEYKGESVLPIFMIILPNNKQLYESGLYDNLYENQQTFLTAYDIHDTFIHLAYSDFNDINKEKSAFIYKKEEHYSGRGESLFNAIGQEKRHCRGYDNYFIEKSSCQCILW